MFGSSKPFPDFGDGVDNDLVDDMYYSQQSMFHRSDKDVRFLHISFLSLTLANTPGDVCLLFTLYC